MRKENCRPRRWLWFVNGIIFTVLIGWGAASFVPLVDCPMCENVEAGPDLGDVADDTCATCDNNRLLTLCEAARVSDWKVEMPNVKLPTLGSDDEKADEPAKDELGEAKNDKSGEVGK